MLLISCINTVIAYNQVIQQGSIRKPPELLFPRNSLDFGMPRFSHGSTPSKRIFPPVLGPPGSKQFSHGSNSPILRESRPAPGIVGGVMRVLSS